MADGKTAHENCASIGILAMMVVIGVDEHCARDVASAPITTRVATVLGVGVECTCSRQDGLAEQAPCNSIATA